MWSEQAEITRNENTESICIHFVEDGSPAAFGESAIRLHNYFPELILTEVPLSEGGTSQMLCGFTLESVITMFQKRCPILIDDEYMKILNV
ncbi:hypothetical protein [Bacteroides gallinarum]|nr:hypothetical protein [Bacteroides gallinarum]